MDRSVSGEPTVRYAVEGSTATVTLSRPERRNAFTVAMCLELLDILDEVERDDAVRAVVVTGAGDHFCAGADLQGGFVVDPDVDEVTRTFVARTGMVDGMPRDVGGVLALRLAESTKPLIAAVNGSAVGVGATMTLPMDVRVVGESARLGFVFARRGLVPEAASTWFLPRVVGISRAMEWVATGRLIGSDEALATGLASYRVPDDAVLDHALELADEIARHTSPVAVAASRQLLWGMLTAPHPWQAHELETRTIAHLVAEGEVAEGVASFLERRAPAFTSSARADLPTFVPRWAERASQEGP